MSRISWVIIAFALIQAATLVNAEEQSQRELRKSIDQFPTLGNRIKLTPRLDLLASEKTKSILDGKSFSGWTQRGGKAGYAVEGETIIGTTVKGTDNSFMCTEKDYGDFTLDLEVNADKGLNSGVQIRSRAFEKETTYPFGNKVLKIPAGRVHGYQVEVDHRPERRWSGGIYEEARRDWLNPIATNSPASHAFKFGGWNHYRVECVGDSIKTWVNDVPAADLVDSETLSGFLGLQVHNSDTSGLKVRFRNIRLADLGRHEWKPLPIKPEFEGAHIIGQGDWKLEDGVVHGTHRAADPEHGHLVTDQTVDDFTIRFKFKSVKGNSGFYFRSEEKGSAGMSGFQAEVDPVNDVGGLYETSGRAWVIKPSADDVKKYFRPQDWNTMTVSTHGRRIVVHVNGYKSAELLNDSGRTEGKLALQLHGGQDVEVYFKDFEMLSKAE